MKRLVLLALAAWAAVITWHVAELARDRWQWRRIVGA